MDQRLKQFALAIKTFHALAGGDPAKVVSLVLRVPDTSSEYNIVGSYGEPDVLGFPINTMWVELDLTSPHYLKVLKLKGFDSPQSYDPAPEGAITNQGFAHTWVPAVSKADSLAGPQWYTLTGAVGPQGPTGPEGPPGPIGPRGPTGPAGVIDYSEILQEVKNRLCSTYGLCLSSSGNSSGGDPYGDPYGG